MINKLTPLLLLALPASAASTFTNAVDTDFNNAGNWDSGLPTDATAEGIIDAGATATMSASYLMANGGSPSVTDIIVNGTLNTGANELQLRSGAVPRTSDLTIGATGILNVDSGGTIDIAGAAADVFVNGGALNFLNGSNAQISKALEVLNGGTLSLGATSGWVGFLGDELVIGDASNLAFDFDAALTHSTILGQSLAVELGAGANLNLNFAAAPTTGSTFTLATDVSGFAGSVGTFTNVNATGLGAGQSATVDYGTLNAGELTVTIVPEPSSTALLGLGGLALVLRRRK